MPYALFDTTLGPCAIAWTERGIVSIQLPEASEDETRARIALRSGEAEAAAPPKWVREAICTIARHLEGSPQDMTGLKLDMAKVPPFHARVYEAARSIAPGKTLGYGELAKMAGSPQAFRAVGQAMAKNPFPIVVPCHRVLAAGGKAGGFSAHGGAETKKRMLAIEGVTLGAPSPIPRSVARTAGSTTGLGFDPDDAIAALSAADKKLALVIDQVGPLRLNVESVQSPFEALAESIVYQQLTGKAAATILARVHRLFGPRRAFTPKAVLAMPVGDLRTAGLSGSKVLALKDLAAKTIDGTVPPMDTMLAMKEEELVTRLTAIRGIGRWTVEMLLIFRLGRPDVLPVNDYGIRKGFARAFRKKELPTPSEVLARGERWRPYRTAASWYLWRANELPPNSRLKTKIA